MSPDIETVCEKCNRKYWAAAEEPTGFRPERLVHCPQCRSATTSSQISSALATLEQLRAGGNDGTLGPLLTNPAELFEDIKRLAAEASAPIEYRRRTLSEWWQDLDLEAIQVEKKLRAGGYADQLLQQRLALIRRCQEIAKTTHEAKATALAHRQAELRGYLGLLQLEEEIYRQQVLRDERIRTLQLEEKRKHVALLADINPPPPPPPPEPPEDPAQKTIAQYRSQAQTRATAKQLAIADFFKEVREIYGTDLGDNEKALRIRAVLDAYRQDFEALPREVRGFVERVESGEQESQEDLAQKEKDDRCFVATVDDFYSDTTFNRTKKAMLIRKLMVLNKRGPDALTPEVRKFVENSEDEFRSKARRIYSSDLPDSERLLLIHALLNTYRHDARLLPGDVREFVERNEKQGDGW